MASTASTADIAPLPASEPAASAGRYSWFDPKKIVALFLCYMIVSSETVVRGLGPAGGIQGRPRPWGTVVQAILLVIMYCLTGALIDSQWL